MGEAGELRSSYKYDVVHNNSLATQMREGFDQVGLDEHYDCCYCYPAFGVPDTWVWDIAANGLRRFRGQAVFAFTCSPVMNETVRLLREPH